MAITYTGIHFNGYLRSSRLGQHHSVWTSHGGLHEQCMAKVDIFPRSSSTLGEGDGPWLHAYLGNTNCWFNVNIICQHLADSASTSHALTSPMTDSSRLERGVAADRLGCV